MDQLGIVVPQYGTTIFRVGHLINTTIFHTLLLEKYLSNKKQITKVGATRNECVTNN
jgi:hypothetical protein